MTKQSDPNSNRSKKRAKRGFVSVEVSTRKGRRAARRSAEKCTIGKKMYKPGEKVEPDTPDSRKLKVFLHTAGGSIKYHAS